MLKVLVVLAAAVVLIIAVVLVIAASKPDSFRFARSAQINAPAEVIFPLINDFHQWDRWSPYNKLDPNMKKTYEGPSSGPGAIYSWSGNAKAGQGRTTILNSKANEEISINLEILTPFACANLVTFTLAPSDGGAKVSWIIEGKSSLISKTMSIFIDMDKMFGKDFEEGLASLGVAAGADAKQTRQAAPATPSRN